MLCRFSLTCIINLSLFISYLSKKKKNLAWDFYTLEILQGPCSQTCGVLSAQIVVVQYHQQAGCSGRWWWGCAVWCHDSSDSLTRTAWSVETHSRRPDWPSPRCWAAVVVVLRGPSECLRARPLIVLACEYWLCRKEYYFIFLTSVLLCVRRWCLIFSSPTWTCELSSRYTQVMLMQKCNQSSSFIRAEDSLTHCSFTNCCVNSFKVLLQCY